MPDSAHADHAATQRTIIEAVSTRLPWQPLDRTRAIRALCALGLAMVVGDLVTTAYGLSVGLREQNPFVVEVLSRYGIAGLVGLKLVAVGWVVVIWRALGRHYGVAAMAGLTIPQSIAVVINVATILSV